MRALRPHVRSCLGRLVIPSIPGHKSSTTLTRLIWPYRGGLNHVSAVYSQIINTQSRLPGDDVCIITIITRAAAAQRGLNIRYPDGMIYHQPGRMPQAVGGVSTML
jgi:hypothetical protein